MIKKFLRDESGASAAEYALILALVGAGIAVAAGFLGDEVEQAMNGAANEIDSANTFDNTAGPAA